MKRSKHQAIYKYLPGIWTNFKDVGNDKLNGNSVTIEIDKWNYRKVEDIFTDRIVSEIFRILADFQASQGSISSFKLNNESKTNFIFVEPAMLEGIDDILGKISPLLFYCQICGSIHSYSEAKYLYKSSWVCEKCKKNSMKQLQLIYSCECSQAIPVRAPFKRIDGKIVEFKYRPNINAFKFEYRQNGNKLYTEMISKCTCGNILIPSNASDGKNYMPFTVKAINLIDKRQGEFFRRGLDAHNIIIAKYLRVVKNCEYEEILKNVDEFFKEDENIENNKEFLLRVQEYVEIFDIEEVEAREKAKKYMLKKSDKKNIGVQKKIEKFLPSITAKEADIIATQLIELDTLNNTSRRVTLEEAIKFQEEMNIIGSENEVVDMNKEFGISNAKVVMDVEIITGTFGFTRKTKDPQKVKKTTLALKSYRDEREDANLVYCTKLETEGILIEFDKVKIINWLLENKIIDESNIPNMGNEESIDRWFMENIKGNEIENFREIAEIEELKVTKNVYGLLHSISHILMKSAGIISGLDKNSLSEIIFPNLATIFIYSNTPQGATLGSLSGMFEQNYSLFIKQSLDIMSKCVFDPICMERDNGSCSACTQLPEITCCHFNKDLNRKLVIGYKSKNENIIGFWK